MGIRLQNYQIFKFTSARLKKNEYEISLTINEGRRNGEVITIGDSQMLRSLRKIKGENDNKSRIQELMSEIRTIKRKSSCNDNIQLLQTLEKELDSLLFLPEIISVNFDKDEHYLHIGQFGFIVNGVKYKRLLCSAGNARRNVAMFIDEKYELELKRILNNDRSLDLEIIPSKFSAYFSLASSSTYPVSTPYFCVIPDCEVTRKEMVDYVVEHPSGDDIIEPIEKEISFNLWDGQGLISPRMAEQWSGELELDYIPSTFIIRSNFIKGMVATFDFHRFSDECGKHIVKDVWGNDYNIRDADIILTASQFKLWQGWNSLIDYNHSCKNNDIGWGVSKYSPKYEKDHVSLNYQFLQVLDLGQKEIESLCRQTLEYLSNVLNNDYSYSLLYLLGDILNQDYDPKSIYPKINDTITRAIILNNNLIHDPYIQNHILHTLNKKIRESYIGNLVVEGFYTTMINDPYAFCEYMFDLPVAGLLQRGEHYNQYWLDRNTSQLASMRAPLTWVSEVNILNLKNDDMIRDWYRYLYSGVVYNVHGCDHMLHGGSDLDGDLVCVTNQKEVIDGAQGGLPVHYDTMKAKKKIIIDDDLYLSDLNGFNSTVGFLTNISTTMYALLATFEKGSVEYNLLTNRLKECRKIQGEIIDSAKGLVIRPIPKHWSNWTKIKESMSEDEKKLAELHNLTMIDNRPYFFRYLYPDYNKKYNTYNNNYDNYCITTFGKSLQQTLLNPESDKEFEIIQKYYRFSPLLDSNCVMNNICHYMETNIREIRSGVATKPTKENVLLLKDISIPLDKEKLKRLYDVYKRYKSEKRNFAHIKGNNGEDLFKTIEQYHKFIRQQCFIISSNICELANLAVVICYEAHPSDSKSFAWGVFGEGLIMNIEKNKQAHSFLPKKDKNGDIQYLGNRYSLLEIATEKEIETEEEYLI